MRQMFKQLSEEHSTSSERMASPGNGISTSGIPTRPAGSNQKVALFIGGLAFNITEHDIQEYFEQYAKVVKLVLLRDRGTNMSKGYAFVTIEGKEAADRILSQKNFICNRRVEIQPASKKNEKHLVDERRKRKRLFVSHVPPTVSNAEFEAFFSQFGEIHNCYIIQNYDGHTNKPYGFVEYDTEQQVMAVLHRKKELVLRGSKLSIQHFKTKEESEPLKNLSSNDPRKPDKQRAQAETRPVKACKYYSSLVDSYLHNCNQDSCEEEFQELNHEISKHNKRLETVDPNVILWRPLRVNHKKFLLKGVHKDGRTKAATEGVCDDDNLRFNFPHNNASRRIQNLNF
jgi:RNA-binding protein Musashi